ncbi:hypothetical protein BZG36_05100 [Bifiguratus adelaidae]|uniref:Uncharacterized protein n=1 Tax=Bifiguratus adelaidae TaxID=1938954 RepID=A0A261XU82_9FUNG|nr:hypothetical protein BZG36_05100 [Bifiguratus adelaidae]
MSKRSTGTQHCVERPYLKKTQGHQCHVSDDGPHCWTLLDIRHFHGWTSSSTHRVLIPLTAFAISTLGRHCDSSRTLRVGYHLLYAPARNSEDDMRRSLAA